MQLSEQVTTLEQSKRLHELWFNNESLYWYYVTWDDWRRIDYYDEDDKTMLTAYTASELIEYLPVYIFIDWFDVSLEYAKFRDGYIIWYSKWMWEWCVKLCKNKNLTHALWDMMIYLLENNLINNDLRDCIECWELVWNDEAVKNCHSHCRLEL